MFEFKLELHNIDAENEDIIKKLGDVLADLAWKRYNMPDMSKGVSINTHGFSSIRDVLHAYGCIAEWKTDEDGNVIGATIKQGEIISNGDNGFIIKVREEDGN